MGFNREMFDLEKQFTFYASYHSDPVNVAIHLLCIWPILATGITILQLTSYVSFLHLATPECLTHLPLGLEAPLNLALALTAIYVVCYVIMDPVAGGIGAVLVSAIYFVSWKLISQGVLIYGYPTWLVAISVHVVAWLIQFVGHGVFEGRAPALLDSLDQALITAPLFVLLEVLFFFGYRKQFHRKMMKQVKKNVEAFKRSGKKHH